jgi:hypothetical protein
MLASIAFVGRRIVQHVDALGARLDGRSVAWSAAGAVAYAASLFLLSFAWWKLLRWQGATVGVRVSHRLYSRTQIAKYLPGNVFHFVARHVAFRGYGASDGALGLAAVCEALGLAGAALLLGLPGLPVALARDSWPLSGSALGRSSIVGLVLIGLAAAVWYGLRGRRPKPEWSLHALVQQARRLLALSPLYVLFMLASAAAAVFLHASSTPGPLRLEVGPAYTLSWLCGFLVPGASGGLGVREAVLVLLLGDDPSVLYVAVGMRLVTTLGDVLFLALGMSIGPAKTERARTRR